MPDADVHSSGVDALGALIDGVRVGGRRQGLRGGLTGPSPLLAARSGERIPVHAPASAHSCMVRQRRRLT